jgi:hypothetical protein
MHMLVVSVVEAKKWSAITLFIYIMIIRFPLIALVGELLVLMMVTIEFPSNPLILQEL